MGEHLPSSVNLALLSNFHPANFTESGITYINSEQYIQAKKAELFNDHKTKEQVMLCDTGLECKDLGRNVHNYNEEVWHRNAKRLCYPGLLVKFRLSKHLADMLLSTGNCQLVEASYDKIWGTGIPLKDLDCLNSANWSGTGILGEMLMEVRQELLNPSEAKMDTHEGKPSAACTSITGTSSAETPTSLAVTTASSTIETGAQ